MQAARQGDSIALHTPTNLILIQINQSNQLFFVSEDAMAAAAQAGIEV